MSLNFLVSFPAAPTKGSGDVQSEAFQFYANKLRGTLMPVSFQVPHNLKVGTLDTLMASSDDLHKVDGQVEGVVVKMLGFLAEVTESTKKEQAELITPDNQHQSIDGYLSRWRWNDGVYPVSKPIQQLITSIQEKVFKSEDAVRGKLGEYNDIRNKLTSMNKKSSGTLSVKPIDSIVKNYYSRRTPSEPVDSEYLCTIFVAIPKAAKKDWAKAYTSFSDKVVPDSSEVIDEEGEFTLVNVVVFKRWADDFKNACRERRYTVREYGSEEDASADQVGTLSNQRDQLKANLTRILKANFHECYTAWIHLKAIRLFVESILRYGLPPTFVPLMFTSVDSKKEKALRADLQTISNQVLKTTDYADEDGADTNALETKYNYVSLKIPSPIN